MQFLRKDAGGARRAEGGALKSLRVDAARSKSTRIWRIGWATSRVPSHLRGCCRNLLSPHRSSAPAPRSSWTPARALHVEADEPTLIRLDEVVPGRRTAPEDCGW